MVLAARLGWDPTAHTYAEAMEALFPDLEALDSNGRHYALERSVPPILDGAVASRRTLDRGPLALPLGTQFLEFIEYSA
jgi:hypothetical protein